MPQFGAALSLAAGIDEFDIIPTSEFIKNLDVVYEQITPANYNDFVITEVKAVQEEIAPEPVAEKEEQQISFTFDLPITQIKKNPIDEPIQKIETKIVEEVKPIEVQNIEAVVSKIVEPKRVDPVVHFTLEDYSELEDNFARARKPVVAKKEVVKDEMQLSVRKTTIVDVNEHEVVDYKEISPLDLTIVELQKRASERREKMKNFNYKFVNKVNQNIDEIEKEPAYKRMGVQLNESSHSSESNQSRTTLNIDENDDLQFRSNNSYLHDNVD